MTAWSEQMSAPVRRLRLGGSLILASGREIALNGDRIASLTIEEGASSALEPGCVLSAECTLDLWNDDGQWNAGGEYLGEGVLTAATLMPLLGVCAQEEVLWHELGVFELEDISYMEGESKLRLRAKDSIAFELAERFNDQLEYPCTLQALWEHAISQTGYLWSGTVPGGSATIDIKPDWKDVSLRTALGYISAAAGCFVRMDRTGTLQLRPLWNSDETVRTLDSEDYLDLESSCESYGPVDALCLKCMDAEEETLYTETSGTALFAVAVSENPLFQTEAAGVDALAQEMLARLAGFKSESMKFEWRGDPALQIGDRVRIRDCNDELHEGVLTRQTLRMVNGFSASCSCDIPQDNNSGVRRAITPEGGLNSAALVGAVNGALLSVGSVTTNKLAASSVTAEKLAAGAVDAGALSAVTAKINSLTAKDIETDSLAAALAAFTVVTAGTAEFDRATVAHLVAQALNLEFGTAGTVYIKNLAVQYAQMVGAAIGNLCIKASDGNYYTIDVNRNGSVTATKATVSAGEIAAGQTNGGQVILETNITAANLNAGNLLATYALVNRIDAARLDVDELFAREAFIDMLRTSKIFAGKSLEIIVDETENASRVFRQEEFPDSAIYVKPGDLLVKPSTGQQYQAVEAGEITFLLDENGNLYYDYDGEGSLSVDGFGLYAEGFELSITEDGRVGTPYNWVLVQDSELAEAAESAQETADMAGNYANEALDKANAALTQADFQRVVRIDDEGLHVGDNLTDMEVLLDSASVNVVVEGVKAATFSDKFIRLGNMQVRKVRGGLAISVYNS